MATNINELKAMLDQKLESLLTQKREEAGQQFLGAGAAVVETPQPSLSNEEFSEEEIEQIVEDLVALDEISKATLGAYIDRAHQDGGMADFRHGIAVGDGGKYSKRPDKVGAKEQAAKSERRTKGIHLAVKKLTRESAEYILDILSELEEGKIDDLKDRLAAKAMEDEWNTSSTKSVANKNAHKPSRIVVKGSKYGGSKQKADVDTDVDIETK